MWSAGELSTVLNALHREYRCSDESYLKNCLDLWKIGSNEGYGECKKWFVKNGYFIEPVDAERNISHEKARKNRDINIGDTQPLDKFLGEFTVGKAQ